MGVRVFTIGYSGMQIAEFIGVLKAHGIEEVVDVRSFPTSRKEDFCKEKLREHLKSSGISYCHLRALGGYRRPSYLAYTRTGEFRRGIEELIRRARSRRIAVMCLETNPRHCHRRFIARELEKRGVEVVHIIGGRGIPSLSRTSPPES